MPGKRTLDFLPIVLISRFQPATRPLNINKIFLSEQPSNTINPLPLPGAVGNMFEIRLTIDDREVVVPEGATILDAARKAGSYVPALCDHPDLKPIGSCKLCIVSVKGLDYYPTACNTPAEEGMVVADQDRGAAGDEKTYPGDAPGPHQSSHQLPLLRKEKRM